MNTVVAIAMLIGFIFLVWVIGFAGPRLSSPGSVAREYIDAFLRRPPRERRVRQAEGPVAEMWAAFLSSPVRRQDAGRGLTAHDLTRRKPGSQQHSRILTRSVQSPRVEPLQEPGFASQRIRELVTAVDIARVALAAAEIELERERRRLTFWPAQTTAHGEDPLPVDRGDVPRVRPRIAVAGSVATDHLMQYSGRFADQFSRHQFFEKGLDRHVFAIRATEIAVRRGGIAANICFGMGCLGLRPLLLSAVGDDFEEYRSWLEYHGVDTRYVYVNRNSLTSRFDIVMDEDFMQMATFYEGATLDEANIGLGPIITELGNLDLVLVTSSSTEAMLRHTREAKQLGIPFAADPSQRLREGMLNPEQLRDLVSGAAYLLCNNYEKALIEQTTRWSPDEVLDKVGVRVTTQASKGVLIEQFNRLPIRVPAASVRKLADPTGVGDAFRAGFFTGLFWGLSLERSAQTGCALAALKLETVGTQEYAVSRYDLVKKLETVYGDAAAEEIIHRAEWSDR